ICGGILWAISASNQPGSIVAGPTRRKNLPRAIIREKNSAPFCFVSKRRAKWSRPRRICATHSANKGTNEHLQVLAGDTPASTAHGKGRSVYWRASGISRLALLTRTSFQSHGLAD